MMNHTRNFKARAEAIVPSRARRRGMAVVYTALLMTAILGTAGLVVDMGSVYREKQAIQRACDAAALAGAWRLAHPGADPTTDVPDAQAAALDYAAKNGYNVTGTNATANAGKFSVLVYYPAREKQSVVADSGTNADHTNWYRVVITRNQPTLFGGLIGRRTVPITATSVALYSTLAPINIKGLGTYGIGGDKVNLSVFGPNGRYSFGDCYSTKFLNDGVTPNPLYNPNGYNFNVTVSQTITNPQIEVYDPDCINSVGVDAGVKDTTPQKNLQIDEIRNQQGSAANYNAANGTSTDATTTKYSVYDDNGTPGNPTDDILLNSMTYGGSSAADIAANNKWVNLLDDTRASRSKSNSNYRVNVTSLSGGSENGFDLRAGPKLTGTQTFDPNNGTSIAADGHIPMNFNVSGAVNITLGTIPVVAAGGTLKITKFDTDVGAKDIVYTCSTLSGMSWPGTLSGDGTFASDVINVPKTYTTPGVWSATYTAGLGDTTVWDMSYSNAGPGSPGTVQLIR